MNKPIRFAAVGLAALLSLAGGEPRVSPARAEGGALVIGSITDNLTREIKIFQPLTDYLAPRLRGSGVSEVKLKVVSSVSNMVAELRSGAVDVYIDSPFIVAEIGRQVPLQQPLRRWKGGVAEYHSVFFARADSSLGSLSDLRGRLIAFDEPYSTSGHLLPKAVLLQQGFTAAEVASTEAPVDPAAIGYVFTGDDVNTLYWVLKGKVAAGVTDPQHYAEIAAKRPGELRILARSIDIPRHIVAHRADLDPRVSRALVATLTSMDRDPEGLKALHEFQTTTRFDEVPDAAATFGRIEAMLDLLPPATH